MCLEGDESKGIALHDRCWASRRDPNKIAYVAEDTCARTVQLLLRRGLLVPSHFFFITMISFYDHFINVYWNESPNLIFNRTSTNKILNFKQSVFFSNGTLWFKGIFIKQSERKYLGLNKHKIMLVAISLRFPFNCLNVIFTKCWISQNLLNIKSWILIFIVYMFLKSPFLIKQSFFKLWPFIIFKDKYLKTHKLLLLSEKFQFSSNKKYFLAEEFFNYLTTMNFSIQYFFDLKNIYTTMFVSTFFNIFVSYKFLLKFNAFEVFGLNNKKWNF